MHLPYYKSFGSDPPLSSSIYNPPLLTHHHLVITTNISIQNPPSIDGVTGGPSIAQPQVFYFLASRVCQIIIIIIMLRQLRYVLRDTVMLTLGGFLEQDIPNPYMG